MQTYIEELQVPTEVINLYLQTVKTYELLQYTYSF